MHIKYSIRTGTRRIKTKAALALMALGLAVSGGGGLSLVLAGTAHAVAPAVVYDSLPSVSPATNYPSQPFQAQQTNEFGDYVHLAGTARQLNSVTVTMSDWALAATTANAAFCSASTGNCDSTGFFWPITVNVYANTLTNDVPNHLLGTKTVTVHIPWRPVGDPSCGSTNNGNGWKVGSTCYDYSGIASNATFDLSNLNLTLPNDVIVGFVYNTQSYGPAPTEVDGPYNSLNIAIPPTDPVTVGTDDSADAVYWNTNTKSYYTNPNCTGGTFCLDTNWTPNGTVAMQITATTPFVATGKILKPSANHHYSGTLALKATYNDGDTPNTDDAVQWAVRQGTCAASTNTVFGNVDGHSDTYNWNGKTFTASLDIRAAAPGAYCFVFNPTDDPGQPDVRLTQTFYINAYVPQSERDCNGNNWQTYLTPSFSSRHACEQWVNAEVEGDLRMANPSQRIEFNVANTTSSHDHDGYGHANTVEYWNYDYPGGLHYSAAVMCSNINTVTNEARFMFQIPAGHPGLSGLYIVAYVKDVHGNHTTDLYGHEATADLATATQWCQTGTGFSPTMYTVTKGNVEVN